jgi:hypothetical protein
MIYSKSELLYITGMIHPASDMYFGRQGTDPDRPAQYLVELLPPGHLYWLIRRRIRAHWFNEDEMGSPYPNVLFICSTGSTQRQVQDLPENCYQKFNFRQRQPSA